MQATPQSADKSTKSSSAPSSTKRKLSDAENAEPPPKERGDRGGRKRNRPSDANGTSEATPAQGRREPVERDRRIYQYSISEGVSFQPCDCPYEEESSNVGLGFNFWMNHRQLITEDLQSIIVSALTREKLPQYLRQVEPPKDIVVVSLQGVCPMSLAKNLPRCRFLASCSSMPIRHATAPGRQWRAADAMHAVSLLMWSQFPTVPFKDLQQLSVVEILSKHTCTFDANHPNWSDELSFSPYDVRQHPRFQEWRENNKESEENEIEAMGKFFRAHSPDSGVWVFKQGQLQLLWNRWDPEQLTVGAWGSGHTHNEQKSLVFSGAAQEDAASKVRFEMELVQATPSYLTAGSVDDENGTTPLLQEKYSVTEENLPTVLSELHEQCRDRLQELLVGFEHMEVLGYPLSSSADGFLDLRQAAPSTPAQLSVQETMEDGEVSESELDDVSQPAMEEEKQSEGEPVRYDLVAVDCEMCYTESGFELTRLSLVSGVGDVIYDEYVKPSSPITNYNTEYSGITEEHMSSATKSLSDVHNDLRRLIHPQTILVGHSMESDLKALKIVHKYIIDTAACYPHPKGPPFKQSLKGLVKQLFGFAIQNGSGTTGHDSVQDAQMALLLAYVKIIEGESFLVGTPGEIHFPPRQFLPEHIESLIERKPAAEQHNSNFRFIFSTAPFNKLWERSLDGDSLTTDMYYTALRLGQSPSPTTHMATTPTSVHVQLTQAQIDCTKHNSASAALQTILEKLQQPNLEGVPSVYLLDLPCSLSQDADQPMRSRHVQHPVVSSHDSTKSGWVNTTRNQDDRRTERTPSPGNPQFELVRTFPRLDEALASVYEAMPQGALLMVITQGDFQGLRHAMVRKQLSKWDARTAENTNTIAANIPPRNIWDDEHEREITILAAHALSGTVFLRRK